MIMPGRSWVAGIDIAGLHLLLSSQEFFGSGAGRPGLPPLLALKGYFTQASGLWKLPPVSWQAAEKPSNVYITVEERPFRACPEFVEGAA
jgi:hypothetical protein